MTMSPPLDICPCVQVSDMTLLVCSATTVDKATAATNCQAAGGLARLDTPAKMSALQDYLNAQPGRCRLNVARECQCRLYSKPFRPRAKFLYFPRF